MVKIGDKVRFLNTTGGGVVKAFQGKNMVVVEDENGFDFPVLIAECVVVEDNSKIQDSKIQDSKFKNCRGVLQPPSKFKSSTVNSDGANPFTHLIEQKERDNPHLSRRPDNEMHKNSQFSTLNPQLSTLNPQLSTLNSPKETPEGERLSVYLAYLPIDIKAIAQSGYEVWFINDSNYFLYFTYLSRQNNSWTSRYHGLIEPNTKIFMEEFGKEALNEMEHVCIQLIAFKQNKPFGLKNALSVELRIDTVKFYKVHCFTENDYFDEDALIFPVVQHDIPEKQLLVSATDLQEALLQKKQENRHNPQPVKKSSKTENPVVEIDLHIGQLLDRTDGMSTGELLNYQLNKFHEVLKQYAAKKGQKIVFIHGKGEGVLRAAIEKELKTRYKSYVFQDASFKEYGFGATMVKIR